jgi:hypothetical protein
MKKSLLVVAVVALAAVGAGQAFAHSSHARIATKLTIVMKDPGCHWFAVGGAYKTSVRERGAVRLVNFDEATIKIVGPAGVQFEKVGKSVVLGKGTYRITMVGQAPDDNHLRLAVY